VVDRDLVTRKITLILEDLRAAAVRDIPEYLRHVHARLEPAS